MEKQNMTQDMVPKDMIINQIQKTKNQIQAQTQTGIMTAHII